MNVLPSSSVMETLGVCGAQAMGWQMPSPVQRARLTVENCQGNKIVVGQGCSFCGRGSGCSCRRDWLLSQRGAAALRIGRWKCSSSFSALRIAICKEVLLAKRAGGSIPVQEMKRSGRVSTMAMVACWSGLGQDRQMPILQQRLSDDGEGRVDLARRGKISPRRARRQNKPLSSLAWLNRVQLGDRKCSVSMCNCGSSGRVGRGRNWNWLCQDAQKGRSLAATRRRREDLQLSRRALRCMNTVDGVASSLRAVKKDTTSTRERKYMFHILGGGQVRVAARRIGDRCTIAVEVDDAEMRLDPDLGLFMHWGLFRADCDAWVALDEGESPPGTVPVGGSWANAEAMRTPFIRNPCGKLQLHMDLDASAAPYSVKFALFHPQQGQETDKGTWFRSTKGTDFAVPVGIQRGRPYPLGVSWKKDGSANFAVYSRHAEHVTLCLYDDVSSEPQLELDLDQFLHRTGDIWHVQVDSMNGFSRYGYKCKGELTWENGNRFVEESTLLDPYARHVSPLIRGKVNVAGKLGLSRRMLGLLVRDEPFFDWDDDAPLRHRLEELVVYKLSVPTFTANESSTVLEELRGTFLGVLQKVDHLKDLGMNAVLLAPVTVHDHKQGPSFPINFFAPMPCYGVEGDALSASFGLKTLVRELHLNDIEVMLEVSYCHTVEGNDEEALSLSMRGIDNATYYITDNYGHLVESGNRGTLNCNYPPVQSLVLDSLRHWVTEYHVDGFCFANAGALLLGPNGEHLSRPPLIEAIAFDPILADAKLVADLTFSETLKFPNWGRWAEYNVRFNNDVNGFLSGSGEHLSSFATRFCGSADVFQGVRGPAYGLNFISSFPAVEEPDEDAEPYITSGNAHRQQMLNSFTALFLSQGIPVLTMGQEYGYSSAGSPTVAANSESARFDWQLLKSESGQEIARFTSDLITLRKRRGRIFQRQQFLHIHDLSWHGREPGKPEWESASAFVAATIHSANTETPGTKDGEIGQERISGGSGDIYVAFNAHNHPVDVALPQPPEGTDWFRIVNTAVKSKPIVDATKETISEQILSTGSAITMEPYSCLVLEARVIQEA